MQQLDPTQLFAPHYDVIVFSQRCKNAVDNDTNETIEMREQLPYAGCEIVLAYDSSANHANQYEGNDFMHITFKYPSTIANTTILTMMKNALEHHQLLFRYMRRDCDITRIYVHQIQSNKDEFITLTRTMAEKYIARNYNPFPEQHGWGNFHSCSGYRFDGSDRLFALNSKFPTQA